uniref:HIT domain-containing protein n=1 Tax=Graphocephala atropunctata TaxID=36148 RepID=A0A1B6LNM4_9HEMI
MHWQFNLYNAMQDPSLIVFRDHSIVIIRDKFPKSEVHFLVLPLSKINDLKSLTSGHISLMHHMEIVTQQFIQGYPGRTFWWGFHAKPTMVQLHMHVVSDDFRGTGLKNLKHWNSFTTAFFVPMSKVMSDLRNHGAVILPSESTCNQILKAPLVCHKCGHRPVNMPSLKIHLLSHIPV